MTTLEKLFVQIFDRKDRVIEQIQQQAHSFTQQLASGLLIDGITPPPWLLSPNCNSHSSNPNELEEDEILSKILLQPPQDPFKYSTGGHSLYYRPVVAGGNINKPLSTETRIETHAPNKDINSSNEPNVTLECHNNDTVDILDHVSTLDDSVKSPPNDIDAVITSIYAAPDTSVARIQRSKSRQKAREMRVSGKTNAKTCLSDKNRTHNSFSGDLRSKMDIHQVVQDKSSSDMRKLNHVSGATSTAEEGNGEKGNVGNNSHSHRLAKSSSSCDVPSLANEHRKIGSFSDKENLDGGIMMDPTVDALQQFCNVNGVIKEVNLPDARLGSYASKNTISGKTRGTQSQNNIICGRITRSRSSRLQTSGINKFSKLGTSVSCNPKGGGEISHSVGDLMHEFNISNELSEAVETSQMVSDINAEISQAICSNEGVLKPVIDKKESSLAANHQENAEIVVGNGPIDEPIATQHVISGANLDPVAVCMESEGLTLKKSSDCCMKVKPKQLNFDEIEKCDANEIFSSLSKKRKLDELSGIEYFHSKESASSKDHKSSCIEQDCYNNIDEFANDAMNNTVLEMNENLVVEDVAHNSMFSQHDDIDVTCEVSLSPKEVDNKFDEEMHSEKSHLNKDPASSSNMQTNEDDSGKKGKESVGGIDIPVSNIKSLFTSSLTKQQNSGIEDCLNNDVNEPEVDIDSSKSKEIEVEKYGKLANMKLNSAKANTCPLNQQKYVDDQPNCFSDSRNFRVNIQRDAIRCDLETPESGQSLLKESASILSSEKIVHDAIICDLPEETDSLHEIQAAEPQEIVTEVDVDDCTETQAAGEIVTEGDVDDSTEIQAAEEIVTEGDVNDSTEIQAAEEIVTDVDEDGSTEIQAAEEIFTEVNEDDSTEIQAAEEIVTEVDDDDSTEIADILKQSESTCILNLIKKAADDSTYNLEADVGPTNSTINGDVTVIDHNNLEINLPEWVSTYESIQSSQNDDEIMIESDEIAPIVEGFIIDDEFGRASIIEQLCKSHTQTPLSTFQQHHVQGFYGFMTDGILDQFDLGNTVSIDEDSEKKPQTSDVGLTKFDSVFPHHQKFDISTPFDWQSKNHYSSPVGKCWERSTSSSGSSGIQLSSNPDLTCFPIEEDPISDEENENSEQMHDDVANENENPVTGSFEMKIEDDEVAVDVKKPPFIPSMKYADRYSSNSVSMEASVPRTCDKVKHNPKNYHGIKVRIYEENRGSSIVTRASSRGNVSVSSNIQNSMRGGIPRMSQKEVKRNNIVSNVTSFIPIIQQKQAAAVCTGKRDIKVKALEAAEAAKRREQEKENERKQKKEALKLERARIGKENAKERELNLKKQEDLLKKKEADIAARKRQREEEEKKQLAKKRKLVAETQKNQKLKYEKSRDGKLESTKTAGMAGNKKGSENLRQNINAEENSFIKQATELRINKNLANIVQQFTSVPQTHDESNDCGEKDKVTSVHKMSPVKVIPVELTSLEKSYDITPYQCSDDEDDNESNDLPTKKFVPSWASKNRLAMVLPLQLNLDPESIFSVDSFCSMDEVLLPRRLQAK